MTNAWVAIAPTRRERGYYRANRGNSRATVTPQDSPSSERATIENVLT